MVVYLDVRSRLDVSAAQLAAREAVKLFTRAGEDASKAFANPLGKALGALDTGALRAQMTALQNEYRRTADVEAESARRMVTSMGQVEVAQKRLAEATSRYGDSSSKVAAANVALADSHARAAKSQRDHADAMVDTEGAAAGLAAAHGKAADSASRAGQVFNAVGIGSVAALGATMFETTKKAGDFQQSMTKLSAAASVPADQLKTISDGILQMAGKVGYSTQELSGAMFDIAKSGYNGADGLKVLNAAAQGANAEQADLNEVVKALTLSMHNFKATPEEAATVMSKMVTAVGESKVPLNDFAGALHSIEPQAAQLHLSLSDVWGVLSQITASGTSADQAADQMANTMRSLSGANAPARAAMQQLGIDADDVSQKLGQRGLGGTMQYLYEQTAKKIDPSTSLINVGDLAKNTRGIQDLNNMIADPGVSDHARQYMEALRNNEIGVQAYTKAARASVAEDRAKMMQFGELNNSVDGFSKRLKGGRDTLETLNQAMNEETGTMSGAAIVMQTTGTHADELRQRTQKIADTVVNADGTVKGFNESQDTLNAKMRDAHAAFGAAEAEIGSAFVPVMMSAAGVAKDVGDALAQHPGIAHAAIDALGALGTAWGAIKIANIAGSILTPIATALGTLIAGEEGATTAAAGLKTALAGIGIGAAIAGVSQIAGNAAQQATGPSGLGHDLAVLGTDAGTGAGIGAAIASVIPGVGTVVGGAAGALVGGGMGLYNMATHAEGGAINGEGPKGRDSVAMWGAPGEHVLTHHDVNAMGGQNAVYNFRNALHRAAGGAIGNVDTTGMQVDTMAVAQAVSQLFPGTTIGGYRAPDGFNEHSSGEAADIMVGGDKSKGDSIASWALSNAKELGVEYVIWQQRMWYPNGKSEAMGDRGSATQNHMDHVHIRTAGGGFGPNGAGPQGTGSMPAGTSGAPSMAATQGFSGGGGGMGGGVGGMGGGGGGYYTANPEAVDRAQEHLTHVTAEIQNAEDRKVHLKTSATQEQKDRLDEEIRHLNVERDEAQTSLQKAQQGTFHAQRGGGRGGGSGTVPGGLPVPLDDNMGTSGGLPGMARYAVSFLEDLVLAPMENAVMASINGGGGAGMGAPSAGGFADLGNVGSPLGAGIGPGSGTGAGPAAPSATSIGARAPESSVALTPPSHGWGWGSGGAQPSPAPAAPAPTGLAPSWSNASGFTHPNTAGQVPNIGPTSSGAPPNLGSMLVPGYTGGNRDWVPSFGDPIQRATGGPSGTDTIPAWLSPGEDVLSVNDVNAMGGIGAVEQFRNALQRSTGGIVPQYFDGGGAPTPTPNSPPPAPTQGQPAAASGPAGAPKPGAGVTALSPSKMPGAPGQGDSPDGPGAVPGAPKDSDTKSLPGLATPGADSNSPLAGLPSSPGVGISGGIIGAAESAASSAGSMFPGGGGAGAAAQIGFSELNRAASFGAQAVGIGVEGILGAVMPNSGSVGGDWATTIPGRLLTGISGVRPTAQNTAGNTTKANAQGDNPGGGDTNIGFQLNGDQHVHSNDASDFSSQMQQASQAANGAYPQSTAGR